MHLGPGVFIPDPPADGGGCLNFIGGLIAIVVILALVGEACSKKTPSAQRPVSAQSQRSSPSTQTQPPPSVQRVVPAVQFVPLQSQTFPSPFPQPVLLGSTLGGGRVFGWQGRRWVLGPPPPNRYAYLCVNSGLSWCWRNPPHFLARPCTQRVTGLRGLCWQ